MTTHDLHNKGALMRVRSAGDGIDSLDNTMQSRIRTNGHVRAAEIVVDGSHLGYRYIHLIIKYIPSCMVKLTNPTMCSTLYFSFCSLVMVLFLSSSSKRLDHS